MTKIKDLPLHERPREKLVQLGPENLSDAELLAILFRVGRKGKSAVELAKEVLKKHSLTDLLDLQPNQFLTIKGIEEGKATSLLAAIEIGKRLMSKFETNLPILSSPELVVSQLEEIKHQKKEYFVVLYLNARNQLVYKETVSIGIVNASFVHPREVFAPALEVRAVNIVLAHNHPSGETEPSIEDREITETLQTAGKILGIDVLDHIIVSKNGYYSFKQHQLL